ncbi:MAG: hypothetical protein QOF60_3065 [Actinomycetota bacterium]|jgi:hypothetical protein|nr:hypothetical protein [Actinomycetota bacterium]
MAGRLLALLAAAAMVVGAVVYRSSRDSTASAPPAPAAVVVCASELGAVCDAIPGATVEAAAVTADRLLAARSMAEAGVAAWLAPGPWAAMVDAGRAQGAPKLFRGSSEALGHTSLVAVVRKGQTPATCGPGPVSWKCIGDAAQNPSFRIGADPARSAIGLLVRAAALTGFIGSTQFGSNDVEGPPGDWLSNLDDRLAAAPGFGARSLGDFLVQQGSGGVFLTTGAAADGAPRAGFDVATPVPAATIEAVLAFTGGDHGGVPVGTVTSALRAAKWEPGPMAGNGGLPSPGVLLALREVVR